MKPLQFFLAFFLTCVAFAGCKTEKEPIQYGKDACAHCKMLTMDPRFGAEIITEKGKIFKFDDINCLISFVNDPLNKSANVAETFVIDYSQPQTLIPAKDAFYVYSDLIKSPMASGVAAFATTESRYEQQQNWQGTELTWTELNSKFK